jgi:hypothetical protein
MKKFTQIGLALGAILLTGSAFAQKQCNLALNMVIPAANQTYNYKDTVKFSFNIKNNGPAAIDPTDTIYYAPVGSTSVQFYTGNTIANGATTATISSGFYYYKDTVAQHTLNVCFEILDQSTITKGGVPVGVTYTDADTTNDIGCVSFTVKGKTTSILDLRNNVEQLSLYPNPANNQVNFTLDINKASNVTVSIKDITGREVSRKDFGAIKSGNNVPFQVDVNNLTSGTYFIELNADERKAVGKISVRH